MQDHPWSFIRLGGLNYDPNRTKMWLGSVCRRVLQQASWVLGRFGFTELSLTAQHRDGWRNIWQTIVL